MNLNDFENYIDPVIYQRGEEYFDLGAVEKLKESGNKWEAVVEGTDYYQVSVQLDQDNEIITSRCNCPYDHGPICKHQVAVFLAIAAKMNGDDDIEDDVERTGSSMDLNKVLNSLSKDGLIKIIEDHAMMDDVFGAKVITEYSAEDLSKSEYKKIIHISLHNEMDRTGYISWYGAGSACSGDRKSVV